MHSQVGTALSPGHETRQDPHLAMRRSLDLVGKIDRPNCDPSIKGTGTLAVTVLGSQHDQFCRLSSRQGFGDDACASTEAGHPTLSDGFAWPDYKMVDAHAARHHELLVAEVLSGDTPAPGAPLVFHTGQFSRLYA